MAVLTNRSGGQVRAEGKTLEALVRAGWTVEESVQPSEAEPKPEAKKAPAKRTSTRRTKTTDK